jgi:hypothetical protein
MTDPSAPPSAPETNPTAATAPPSPPKKGLNVFGLIALVLGVVAFVLAVTPASPIAWVFAIPAIVLGIVGLTRKTKGKGTSIAGLTVGAVAWLVSIIVTVVLAASAVVNDENSTTVTRGSGSTHTSAPSKTAGIGDTVTNSDGVAFTVNSVTCGLKSAPDDIYGTDKPTGQFCQVKFTVKNGSTSSIDLDSTSVTGHIGKSSYDADDKTDRYGSDTYLSSLNPGLTIACIVYLDIPKAQKLTSVELGPSDSFGIGNVTVNVG